MTKKNKKKKTSLTNTERYRNLPTRERLLRGNITIRNNIAQQENPLRIDKLLHNGIIDEMQHCYGMQIITLWTIASRPFIRAMKYEPRTDKTFCAESINLSRMSAEDQFYKTMAFMGVRERSLIEKICFEELGAIEAGRSLKLPVNSITVYVRAAFDALGDALARMRDEKRALEKPPEVREEAAL